MDTGVLSVPLASQSRTDALEYLASLGVDAVELGCGGHPGDEHLPTGDYLDDETAQSELRSELDEHGLYVSALATHNNPLHPDEDRAARADTELRDAIRLAGQLDVGTVTCFSGLPGGASDDVTPNWITAPWPPEHAEALQYQWERAIDYWTDLATFAKSHDVHVAIEMHPNMLVYEPHGLLRLRRATNEHLGANFDPSHLYWQNIDPVAAIRYLGAADAIHHVHAKDTELYDTNVRTRGVLDTTPYDDESERSWLFRTVGYGHGEQHWKRVVSALRIVGYDGALSIEHEDSLMSSKEGLEKAVELLQRCVLETQPEEPHWVDS
ncbi:sugar phosphate isomerase/epimerase family protein [Halorientalis brevis]|uniref:Sugar phosphate isomerase/epimerase family protein n=1 Tax=Halorientalis brevis TaxID=1126241 RepID=A0ABD6CDM4_9EURY|nr:sugar phosphate isomerase/epimerase [Halorientalis brevis]